MSYVRKALQPGEKVLYEGTLHWTIYSTAIGLLVLAMLFGIWTVTIPPNPLAGWAFAAILFGALVAAADAWITRYSTEIVVTDVRLIHKTGLVRYVSTEKTLDRIDSVDVSQSIAGRALDYGNILIRGTGTTMELISDVDEPLKLRNAIMSRSTQEASAKIAAKTA